MRRFLWITLAVLGLLLAGLGWAALRPDFDLRMEREVASPLPAAQLGAKLADLPRWRDWHYRMREARMAAGQAAGAPLAPGSKVELVFLPKGLGREDYVISARVSRWEPGKAIGLELENDSRGRLTRVFSRLAWTLEIRPEGAGSAVRATVEARTSSWQARLYGVLAPRVILNQALYANLEELAGVQAPFRVEIVPESR